MRPLDLIGAAAWDRAVFTTYALGLSFFEAVALDRLIRGGGRSALILADPEGIRSGLSEKGAHRAGRDYELEPIADTRGVFHPKLSLFFAEPLTSGRFRYRVDKCEKPVQLAPLCVAFCRMILTATRRAKRQTEYLS